MTIEPTRGEPQDLSPEHDDALVADDAAPADVDHPGGGMERLSTKAHQAVEVLAGLFDRMGFEARVENVIDGEQIEIELGGADAGRIIGKKGQTLDALQFVVNKVVNRFPDERRHVVLDVEGYKDRRDESLRDMAFRLAERASRTGKVISVSPMPSRERRVIHLALADSTDVTTESEGEGAERRVRIIPSGRTRRRPSSR